MLGPDAKLLAGPAWVGTPTDEDPVQERPVVGSAGGGLGVAWTGSLNQVGVPFRAYMLFRDLGCDLAALETATDGGVDASLD